MRMYKRNVLHAIYCCTTYADSEVSWLNFLGRSLPDGGNTSYNQIGGPPAIGRRSPKMPNMSFHPGSWRNGTSLITPEGECGPQQTGPSGIISG